MVFVTTTTIAFIAKNYDTLDNVWTTPIIFLHENTLLGSLLTGRFFLYHQIDKEFENIQKPHFNFCIEIKYIRKKWTIDWHNNF